LITFYYEHFKVMLKNGNMVTFPEYSYVLT